MVHGALVAYDATAVANGTQLKQLFHSEAKPANELGNFAKYSTPVVANGKVYVGTFSNKVVQYGLITSACARRFAESTTMLRSQTSDALPTTRTAQEQPAAIGGLKDLDAMTFSCAKSGLNAAGREAAKAPSQGAYQFAYFRIIKDAHHSFYEVHFKSNYSE